MPPLRTAPATFLWAGPEEEDWPHMAPPQQREGVWEGCTLLQPSTTSTCLPPPPCLTLPLCSMYIHCALAEPHCLPSGMGRHGWDMPVAILHVPLSVTLPCLPSSLSPSWATSCLGISYCSSGGSRARGGEDFLHTCYKTETARKRRASRYSNSAACCCLPHRSPPWHHPRGVCLRAAQHCLDRLS